MYEATDIDIDLGHVTPIVSLQRAGDRGLSIDMTGHWALWGIAGHQILAQGDTCSGCPTFLLGDTVATRITGGIEVRSASTGTISATIATDGSNLGVARDGSYVWAATATSLRAWSPTGMTLLDVAGNYATAHVFGAQATIRVAAGPAGASTIEAIQIGDHTTSRISFGGTFHSWFDDGEHFLTTVGTAVRVYAKDGTQLAFASLPTIAGLTGQGNHVWTYEPLSYQFRLYASASLDAPVQTYTFSVFTGLFPAGDVLGVYQEGIDTQTLEILTLEPSVSLSAPIPVPVNYLSAFGGDPSGWLIGNRKGVVLDSAAVLGTAADRRALSLGRVWSASGTNSGTAAIATASGRTLVLGFTPTTTTVVRELALESTHLELSQDATLIVATADLEDAQYHDDRSLRVVRVADGAVLYTWPYHWSDYPNLFFDFSFSRTGLVLCQLKEEANLGPTRIFSDVTGATLPSYGPPIQGNYTLDGLPRLLPRFSPDGRHAAFDSPGDPATATVQLYTDGMLAGAVPGVSFAWIDDDHLLVVTYRTQSGRGGITPIQDQAFIYDPTGTQRTEVLLPTVTGALTPVGGSLLYSPYANAVIDDTTGHVTWQGDPAVHDGVIVGDSVLFTRGPKLFRASFR